MTHKRKTAYLLILVMLVTLLPHTYYAASFNHVNKVLTVMANEILTSDEAPILSLYLIDELEENAIFYLELSGGQWLDTAYEAQLKAHQGSGFLEIKPVSKSKLQIKLKGANLEAGTIMQIPLALQMTGQIAKVTVRNNNTVVSSGTYEVAQVASHKGSIAAVEVPTTTDSGFMASLVIEEPFSKAFSKAVAQGKRPVIELRLNHNAYAFSLMDSQVCLEGSQGFEDLALDDFLVTQVDAQTLALTLPDTSAATYTGAFTLSGLFIQLTDKEAAMDTLTVTASGDLIETTVLDVLEVMDYAITLTGESQTVRAGSMQKLSFTLEEQVEDSLIRSRATYFTFTEGVTLKTVNGKVPVYLNGVLGYYPTVVENGEVVGFEISRLPEGFTDYNFTVEVVVMPQATGNIEVIAEGRSLVETLSIPILEIYQPFEISINGFDALVGVKDQLGGQIRIKERAPGELIQGEKIILALEESQIKYSALPEILVTAGDLRLGEAVINGCQIEIPIIRSSHEASTVVIRNFKVTVDQTIATGQYKMQIGGGALTSLATKENIMPMAEAILIQVTQVPVPSPSVPNDEQTEAEEEMKPSTTVLFTLGQKAYQVGVHSYTMEAAPYASGGRIMLPIKYVSEALGITADAIKWNHLTKTVTIHAQETIHMTLGSTIMTINNEKVTMSAAPEAMNGRTFIPVAEITRALKVTTNWDHTKKQVSFLV